MKFPRVDLAAATLWRQSTWASDFPGLPVRYTLYTCDVPDRETLVVGTQMVVRTVRREREDAVQSAAVGDAAQDRARLGPKPASLLLVQNADCNSETRSACVSWWETIAVSRIDSSVSCTQP